MGLSIRTQRAVARLLSDPTSQAPRPRRQRGGGAAEPRASAGYGVRAEVASVREFPQPQPDGASHVALVAHRVEVPAAAGRRAVEHAHSGLLPGAPGVAVGHDTYGREVDFDATDTAYSVRPPLEAASLGRGGASRRSRRARGASTASRRRRRCACGATRSSRSSTWRARTASHRAADRHRVRLAKKPRSAKTGHAQTLAVILVAQRARELRTQQKDVVVERSRLKV